MVEMTRMTRSGHRLCIAAFKIILICAGGGAIVVPNLDYVGTGAVRPSALAVLRLITKSNFVGWTTGRSAGVSPLRMRPVYWPA
jgi:hypothetical protein